MVKIMILKEYAWIFILCAILLVIIAGILITIIFKKKTGNENSNVSVKPDSFVIEKEIVLIHADEFISIEDTNGE